MFNHYVYILWLSSNIYFGMTDKAESSADVNIISISKIKMHSLNNYFLECL